ncbi:MAG: acetate--CoA ligase [Candidatus Margulisiibacteriota bacterium]
MSIETLSHENRVFEASATFKAQANLQDGALYNQAKTDRLGFWEDRAKELRWMQPWHTVLDWQRPYAKWFVGGKLNASANCLDVHLESRATKPALVWEGEPGDTQTLTYAELHQQVTELSYQLKHRFGVQKGHRVTLYLPLVPELVVAVLACARIGAIHSVVFGGFSAQSLKDRILDSGSELLITADGGYRRGGIVNLKEIADAALDKNDTPVKNVLVLNRVQKRDANFSINWINGRDHDYGTVMAEALGKQCEPEAMDSEDTLFILYTSGTTGKPKGIMHSTGGYLTHAHYSTKAVFDLKDSDVYWCTADVGWITGHSYVVYGPLSNGATVFLYEGAPDFPDKDRFWELIAKYKISIFYTAPTAIRAFMKWGTELPARHNLSSLRLLGTVGEPINPEAWVWYHQHIGGGRCPIVDTWWQTETGGIMISNLPALNPMKPGYAGLPLPGISAQILETDGRPLSTGGGLLSLTEPWPSMLRGIWGDPARYEDVYWSQFETYFAGDGATVDEDGYFMVLGRVDDVLNVAGHRIGTMEVESALVDHASVAEAAVVGRADDLKGQAIVAFVILKESAISSPALKKELIAHVGTVIGAIAKPADVVFTPELPKTRSGKIMRRLLKDIVAGNPLGDTTTLANPAIVSEIADLYRTGCLEREKGLEPSTSSLEG